MSWETFNEEGFRTLHDVQSVRGVRNPARSQNARFSLAHRLAATFPGAGNASRKPETTVTEATTAGRGDHCGVVHNVRGRVGPRGLNRPPCSTKSSSAGCEWRIVVAVLISSRPVSARKLARALRLETSGRLDDRGSRQRHRKAGGKACLLDADHRACGWVSIAEAVQSGQPSWLMSPTTFSPSTATAPTASKSSRKLRQSFRKIGRASCRER